jgi:seryl-tRNA synthetase
LSLKKPTPVYPTWPIPRPPRQRRQGQPRGKARGRAYPLLSSLRTTSPWAALDILDFDTATKVTGTKFYYLKNEGVILEMALTRYALDKLMAKGFMPFTTPTWPRPRSSRA